MFKIYKTNPHTQRLFIAIAAIVLFCFVPTKLAFSATDYDYMLIQSVKKTKLDVAGAIAALNNGANPNAVKQSGRNPLSVFFYLCSATITVDHGLNSESDIAAILNLMIKKGWKIQPEDSSSVYFPVSSGTVKFLEILLQQGFDPNTMIDGQTLAEIAEQYGKKQIVNLLEQYGSRKTDPYEAKVSRFLQAATDHNTELMKDLLQSGLHVSVEDKFGHGALVNALRSSILLKTDYDAIIFLLSKGANPNWKNESDFSGWGKVPPLHMAIFTTSNSFRGPFPKYPDAPLYAKMVLQDLLTAGAYVSGESSTGATPLHVAAQWNNIVAAEMLIKAGSKINPKDNVGKTPLNYAQSGEMIALLKKNGAVE